MLQICLMMHMITIVLVMVSTIITKVTTIELSHDDFQHRLGVCNDQAYVMVGTSLNHIQGKFTHWL